MRPGYDLVRIEILGNQVSSCQPAHAPEAENLLGSEVVADEVQKGRSAPRLES